ncbi:MAG: FHA domain-containing protein [Paracoccaceae bacterium]
MRFLNGLFGRSAKSEPKSVSKTSFEVDIDEQDLSILQAAANARVNKNPTTIVTDDSDAEPSDLDEVNLSTVATVMDSVGKPRQASVNIWDLDDEDSETASAPEAPAVAAPDRASSRARRNRTRLIGFDKSDGDVVDIFDDAPKTVQSERVQFPVGWVLVVEGPGRGHCFALSSGMAQIGRGEDQSIQLDFGDASISRTNHAAIVYDPESRKFLLGHGGKANIVRLNNKPVISNEDLADNDKVTIGETTLQIKTLCGVDFDWSDTDEGEEHDDVAIA